MRTVQEWRDEVDRDSEAGRTTRVMPGFREMLDGWIAEGHGEEFVKVTVIDSGETGFELTPAVAVTS